MAAIDRDGDHLYPGFKQHLDRALRLTNDWCAAHFRGYRAVIVEGYRTVARQQELYAQGRTAPGPKVTNCDGVRAPSNHQSACAADVAFRDPKGNITWDVPERVWQELGHEARAAGLEWGGDWKSVHDLPHLQVPMRDARTYAAAAAWKAKRGLK